MELKSYQKKVIADLTRYLELLNETKSDAAAFRLFWQEKISPDFRAIPKRYTRCSKPLLQGADRRRQDLYCLQRRSPHL